MAGRKPCNALALSPKSEANGLEMGTAMATLNGYKAFYDRKVVEVHAETSLKARDEAARVLKVPAKKQYMISVVICERADGSQVVHQAVD